MMTKRHDNAQNNDRITAGLKAEILWFRVPSLIVQIKRKPRQM